MKNTKSGMGYYALGNLELWELGQNSNYYCLAFYELTDTHMYLYVEFDWTRKHQYLTGLYFEAQIEGGGGTYAFWIYASSSRWK